MKGESVCSCLLFFQFLHAKFNKLTVHFRVRLEYLLGEDNTLPPVEYETLMHLPGMKNLIAAADSASEADINVAAQLLEILKRR